MAAVRILVADDDHSFAEALSSRLTQAGYETTVVTEGVRVMEAVRRDRPNLIILDLKMPAGGGAEVLTRLKKDSLTRRIPVIVITGTFPHLQKEILEQGAAAFFVKPYDPELLQAKINELLNS